MENASKALIMAGGVLIGVLIISLAVYLFVDFGSTSAQITSQNEQKQLAEFNSKFTAYEEMTEITIYDIISLAGYAEENNQYYKDVEDKKINVFIKEETILTGNKDNLIKEYVNNNGILTYFKVQEIKYTNGRVSKITFKDKSACP